MAGLWDWLSPTPADPYAAPVFPQQSSDAGSKAAPILPPPPYFSTPPDWAQNIVRGAAAPLTDAGAYVGGMMGGQIPFHPAEAMQEAVKLGSAFAGPKISAASLGAMATPFMRAGKTALRDLPADNYLKPLSEYSSRLWRETSPEDALYALPHSNSSMGYGLGEPRKFYADTPDLAIGQGVNKGVKIEYDSAPFQGQINKKPGWEPLFQRGNAEYLAEPAPGMDAKAAVRSFEVSKADLVNAPRHVQSRFDLLGRTLKENGWDMTDTGKSVVWKRQ